MTGRRIPMSVFRATSPDGGEAYLDYLKRKDVKVVQYVIVAETHSPSGTQITTVREGGTEDDACDLLRRALADD
jgi:hypothetical protein